jgi:hypothetical protein
VTPPSYPAWNASLQPSCSKVHIMSIIMGKVFVIWKFKMGGSNLHTDWVMHLQERDFYLG